MKVYTSSNIPENSLIKVEFPKNVAFDSVRIASSCFYSVYYEGRLVQFGPYRRTNDKLNLNELRLSGNTDQLEVKVLYYGIPTFDIDSREFLFSVELCKDGEVVVPSSSPSLEFDDTYISESNRYSFQRGFIERHDLTRIQKHRRLETREASDYSIVSELKDNCRYLVEKPKLISSGDFHGFDNVYEGHPYLKERENKYDVVGLLRRLSEGHLYYRYKYDHEITGVFHLEIDSEMEQTVYLAFEEYSQNGKWIFSRSTCNDIIEIKLKKGRNSVFSAVPYCYMHAMLIAEHQLNSIIIETVKIQNDSTKEYRTGGENIDLVLEASRRTFAQNAFDLFTDCPGRERGGWLCDSYFEGIAEPFYTGGHSIEKVFLENFALAVSPELPPRMVPMCFPSIHKDHTFIPNWALWFIVEAERYYKDTNDDDIVAALKPKILGILDYFAEFENELGLLENLESWEFIEWSKATEDEYIKPISFVTNMLYKGALDCAYNLYGDERYLDKSNRLKKTINDLSYDGRYFLDNAKRVNGEVAATKGLISETAQYFAYFFKIRNDDAFLETVLRAGEDDSIVGSAVFIGKYLRLLILFEAGKYREIIDEFVPYFLRMAKATGTIWEKEDPNASCNHGFASVLGPILYECCLKVGA